VQRENNQTIGDNIGVTMTFLIYLVLMLVSGYIAYRRTTNLSDQILSVGAASAPCLRYWSGYFRLGL